MNLQSEENESGGDQSKFNQFAFGSAKEFNLKIKGVKEVCKGYINEVDGNKSEGYVLEDIVRELRLRRTEAPRRPPRVFMFGPPGAGKQTLGKKIAAKYQLVYLKVKNLIKDHIRRNEGSDEAKDLKRKLKMNEPLSNEFVVELIRQRMSKPDCKVNGWILDGAPMNLDQTLLLKQLGISPQLVVTLDINDELVFKRLEHRRWDPITGQFHYLNQEPLPAPFILKRLIQDPLDSQPMLEKSLQEYNAFVLEIVEEFKGRLIKINGEDSH